MPLFTVPLNADVHAVQGSGYHSRSTTTTITLCGSLKRARLDVARCQAMKQLVHVCRLDTFNMPHEEELDEDGDLRMQHTLSAGHGHGHGQHAGGAGKHASGAGGDTPADEDALQVSAVVPGSTRDWFSDA